jgi:hypothetical protein
MAHWHGSTATLPTGILCLNLCTGNHTMPRIASSSPRDRIGPYCLALTRGTVGDRIDGRSREGKFLRRVEAELVAHVGGSPSFAQSLLIRRAARSMLQLELLDAKMSSGSWTAHDARTQGGLNNAVRLTLRELGIKPPKVERVSPLAAHFAKPLAAAE